MPAHLPRDPQYESRMRESFARQRLMQTLGFMREGGDERHVFTMLATVIAVRGRDGVSD